MIVRELPAPVDLPALQHAAPQDFPLLLQSIAGGNALSRWDLLFWHEGSGLRADAEGRVFDLNGTPCAADFLAALDAVFQSNRIAHGARRDDADALPFRGGWALFMGYEQAASIEPRLSLHASERTGPQALALRCPAALVHDRIAQRWMAVGEDEPSLQAICAAIDTASIAASQADPMDAWHPPIAIIEDEAQRFLDGVATVKDYLAAGDVFQVNLSRGWRAVFDRAPSPSVLYQRLCAANPAPFAGLLRHGAWAMASSSPERLVSVQGSRVQTRPIAGTRPRFAGDDDAARIRELIGHPKERAEHIMLIDLERNDLGRVCMPGSVSVDELMIVETYAHVHHIVSNVSGELRQATTPGEVIRAVFPGGTITGCPKVRCMEIIAELEQCARGPYTGALGYLNRDGDMDLNILIRSLWTEGNEVYWRAGAGLVVDSDAAHELEETRAKARGLLRAMEDA